MSSIPSIPSVTNLKRKFSSLLLLKEKLPEDIVDLLVHPCFPIQKPYSNFDLVIGELQTIFAEKSRHSWLGSIHTQLSFVCSNSVVNIIQERAKAIRTCKKVPLPATIRFIQNAKLLKHNWVQLY